MNCHMVLVSFVIVYFIDRRLNAASGSGATKKDSTNEMTSAQLMQYNDVTGQVVLNHKLLESLSALEGPLHVVTAIGDARIGKSTALNVMAAILSSSDKKGRVHTVPRVFSVCQSLETCTKGIWVYTLPFGQGGHILLIDVEGTDLGGDLVTTQFSLLTSYLSSDVLLFLKESVPKRTAIFLHELARLKERLKSHNSHSPDASQIAQMLYVIIRDPLKPPEDMSLKSYVSQALTNPSYCLNTPEECRLLGKHFPLANVNVYSLPYVSRRHQKSLDWTLKDKSYSRTIASITSDLKSSMEKTNGGQSSPSSSTSGQVFSGVVQTFLRTLQSHSDLGLSRAPPAVTEGSGSSAVCQTADCTKGPFIDTTDMLEPENGRMGELLPEESGTTTAHPPPPADPTVPEGPQSVGEIDIEKIITSPFETMGPGVYSFVMDNIKRLQPSSSEASHRSTGSLDDDDEDEESDNDDEEKCSEREGPSCMQGKPKKDTLTKWGKAVRDFIDDIADALDDFFSSVMYE